MPIQWIIEEESPIGTVIGTVKETLLLINNSSQLIDQLSFQLNNDGQSFLLNSQTGLLFLSLNFKNYFHLFRFNYFKCTS